MPVMPDTEAALRSWLREYQPLNTLIEKRVFFGVPKGTTAYPLVTMKLVSNTTQRTDANIFDSRISFDCWAATKNIAFQVAQLLVQALDEIRMTRLNSQVIGYGCSGINVVWYADPADDTPRYIVDCVVSNGLVTPTSSTSTQGE